MPEDILAQHLLLPEMKLLDLEKSSLAAGGLLDAGEQESLENSPPPAFDEASGEVTGQLVEATVPGDDGPRAAVEADPEDEPEPGERGRHTGNVGPTRPGSAASWDDEDESEE